jgi:hypothetical protein
MPVLRSDGLVWVEVDDREASVLGGYWNAVHRFRDSGELGELESFSRAIVGGLWLEVDPDQLEYWAAIGELDFENIYEPD